MSLYIPPKVDQDLLRTLRDIERQLDELKRSATTPSSSTDTKLIDRLEVVESRLNTLSQFERVENPPADYKNDGNPSRVLHEDGTWLEPLAGIAKAVPPGMDSSRTRPTNLINLLGSLAVTGAISGDTVRSRNGRVIKNLSVGGTVTGNNVTLSSAASFSPTVLVINSNDDANAGYVILRKTSASPADNDVCGTVLGQGYNDAVTPETISYGYIAFSATDVSDGTEDGKISFVVTGDGSPVEEMTVYDDTVYVTGTMSAGTVTDRTPAPDSVQESYDIVESVEGSGGSVDKAKMHRKLRVNVARKKAPAEEARNLSMLVSALTDVVKDLNKRIKSLEDAK